MHVFPALNHSSDKPFWVSREIFYDWFDQADFINRNVADVTQAYLKDWFYTRDDGRLMFWIPTVGAIGRRTDLIGSRHRLAVILPHLKEIPFAFAHEHLTTESLDFLHTIPKHPLNVFDDFFLPDLPVCDRLP
jgi:hypothetical protein